MDQQLRMSWPRQIKRWGLRVGLISLMALPGWIGEVRAQKVDQLSQELDQAVAQQQWDRAAQIIDQMIAAQPSWEPRLSQYRNQLQELASPEFPDLPPLPQGSSGAGSSSTETATGSQGSQTDCSKDVDCLLDAASTCQPARGRFTAVIDQEGIQGSGVNDLEIQGQTQAGCRTVTRIESVSRLDLSGVGIELGSASDQLSLAIVEELLQGTVTTCLYNSGADLRAVLEKDLGRREADVEVSEIRPAGGSLLQGPVTLDGRVVADCQIQMPNQLGGIPFDFGDLF